MVFTKDIKDKFNVQKSFKLGGDPIKLEKNYQNRIKIMIKIEFMRKSRLG